MSKMMSKIMMLCGALVWASQASAVTLTTNPSTLSFSYQIGSSKLPVAQTISVKVDTGVPTFTAVTPGIDEWVTVDPSSGSVPTTLNVRVNPTSLAAATYSSTITLTVTGVPVVTIPVTLVVSPPAPTLTLSSTSFLYAMTPISTSMQTLNLTTNGEPISYVATPGATWLSIAPAVGVVLPGPATALTITVDSTTLAPQIAPYTGKITLVLTGASVKSVNITVNVTVNSAAPTISTVWPNTLPLDGPAQTVTITGTNFYGSTLAEVQGVAVPLATTVFKDSSTVIQAVIPASLLTVATTLNILVSNPAPGGNSLSTVPVVVGNAPAILGIVNSASFAPGPVSPGEIITIFGSNIGPATPAPLVVVGGFVTTSLSNVSATVDGHSAAMVYVSQNQISIQVPYEVSIGANKAIVVTNGVASANSTVTTIATAPGIFTANGTGTGQAAALNYDATTKLYSLNTGTNLANIGDVIVLYLTGEGIYNSPPLSGTASDDGYIVPLALSPLPQVSPAPTVTIGGQAADVTNAAFFAGPIPGSMLGLLQINAVVPSGATTGIAVPVTVTIGGNTSPAGVTLAIHP
jgi:uncharacterized protein (TIGR03437 family)